MLGPDAASAERFARSGSKLRELVVILALAAAYYLAARLGLLLAFAATNASPLWPPSGIALAAILLLGNRVVWPGIALGAFASNFVVFGANDAAGFATIAAVSAAIACGNTAEALLGAYVLRRAIGVNAPDEPQEVLKFALISLVVCMPAALVGMASLVLSGIAPAGAYGTIWLTWWLGDAAGLLIVAPAILAWANARLRWNRALALEIAVSLAGLLAVGWLVFGRELRVDSGDRFGAYLFIPAIAWAAYRFGARGVATASLLVTGIAVWGTTHGLGPFARGSLNDALILLEIFIGLCAVTGLALAADLAQRRRLPIARARLADIAVPWATLLAGIAVAVLGWHLIAAETERSARDRFEYLVNGIQARIAKHMQAYEQVLRGGAGLFAASKSVERDEWREYVQRLRLDENYPGIQGLGYAKRIAPAERDEHLRQIRAEGFSEYTIRPAGEREEYTSIIYLEPFMGRNLRAFGYDMFSEPVRHAAMSRARDTGETALSGTVKLAQETEEDVQAGFLMYVPVYRNASPVANTVERGAALEGYVYSPFRMNDLMRRMLDKELNGLALEIFDGDSVNLEKLMYDNQAERRTQSWHPLFTAEAVMKIEDHFWTLRVASLPEFEVGVDRQKAQVVLIAGIAVALLFFIIVRSLAVTRVRAFAIANKMTAALRESEVKFRSLAESASEAMVIADQEGRIVSWNRGACAMFGQAEAEIMGQPLTVLMPERFHAAHSLGLQRMRQTGEGRFTGHTLELTGLRTDGSEFPLELSLASWVTSAGRFYSGIIRDITERKRAEEFLKGTFEESPDAALVVDNSGSIVRANEQSEKLFGYSRDRLLQLRVTDLIPERFRSEHDAHVGKYFASPRRRLMGAGLELRGRRVDGTEFPIDVMLSPLSGSGLVIAIIRDITERKRTEDGLRMSEERFQFISRATNDVVWDWNPITNQQWWNEAFQTTFGYQAEEIENVSDLWTNRVHPDDRERVTQHIHQVIKSGGQAWSQEYRFRRADGTYAIVVDRGYLVRNDKGEPVRMLGSMMDITERKRKEEELRASEERFRLLVDGVADYAILMLDAHGRIASWNAAAERIKGYCAEEIIGKHFFIFYSKADVERGHPQRALEVAAAEGRYEDEGWRLRKDGSAFWANVVITALRDEAGNLRGFAKVTRDLTDRKQKQQAISSALKEKEILLKEVYHRVKNNLQVITSLLNLQLRTLPQGESRNILKTSAERVRAMALVHEMLYQSGNLSSIAIGEYIRDLCTRLRTATGADERGITLTYDIEPIEIGLEIAVPLGLLVNELISNSLKHAFPEGQKGEIKIAFTRCDDGSMRLTVADNGVGLPPGMSFATSPSLGLKLVSTLAAQLDGELKVESREGTEVALNFGRRAKERAAA